MEISFASSTLVQHRRSIVLRRTECGNHAHATGTDSGKKSSQERNHARPKTTKRQQIKIDPQPKYEIACALRSRDEIIIEHKPRDCGAGEGSKQREQDRFEEHRHSNARRVEADRA